MSIHTSGMTDGADGASTGHQRFHAHTPRLFRQLLPMLGLYIGLERRLLQFLCMYAVVIGFLALIVPLTVQELVTTFAVAVQPMMVVTLATIMVLILFLLGGFRVLQFYAVDMLERRLFVRVSLSLAQQLPTFKEQTFTLGQASRFFETIFMQRAMSTFLTDFINIVVGSAIGLTLLIFYHPAFLIYDVLLVGGFVGLAFLLGQGGLRSTLAMSEAKYATFHWFQEVADNLDHFKAVGYSPLVTTKVDRLAHTYTECRRTRLATLIRQYGGLVWFQALAHGGVLGLGGWLLAAGQLTIGQFVAAEVIVGSLLAAFDSVAKRIYVVYYFFTAVVELDHLLSLPKDVFAGATGIQVSEFVKEGVQLECRECSYAPEGPPVFKNLTLHAEPGEKLALIGETEIAVTSVAKVLAGLYTPSTGAVRYNGIDLHDLDADTISGSRGVVLGSHLTLFEGTLEENITLGRPVSSEDVLWALGFVRLYEQHLPITGDLRLTSKISEGGRELPRSVILRILIARAIVARPKVLILEGLRLLLHERAWEVRETIFRRLCARDAPWTTLLVTTDPAIEKYVERSIYVE